MTAMLNSLPALATLSAEPRVWENVQFVLSGFIFVLIVLAIIGVLTSAVGAIFKRHERKPVPLPARKVTPVMPPPPEEDPALPAVVAAAVYSIMGEKPHRIINIRPTDESWAREGRRSILGSHKVR